MIHIKPKNLDELQKIFRYCTNFEIMVRFTNSSELEPLDHSLPKPFIAINLEGLNRISPGKKASDVNVEIGVKVKDLVNYCKENGLETPVFLKSDLEKSMWQILKENSLTLSGLLTRINLIESVLPSGLHLQSHPNSPVNDKFYNLKKLIVNENENILLITNLQFLFNRTAYSLRVKVKEDYDFEPASLDLEINSRINDFVNEWKGETKAYLVEYLPNKKINRTLHFTSNNQKKLELLQSELGIVGKRLEKLNPASSKNLILVEDHLGIGAANFDASHSLDLTFLGNKDDLIVNMRKLNRYLKKGSIFQNIEISSIVDQVNIQN